ncbi:ATP-binding cassette domain-containing protein [Williamsia sp. SKLECPSW1]
MNPPISTVPAVEVIDVVKTYGGVRALDGISFAVEPGEVVGLLGPNGSGKTTTVSLLSTLQRPTSGVARIAGHDVVDEAPRVRELISLTGQYASVDPDLTTAENLSVFGRLTGLSGRRLSARVDDLVERFDLGDVRRRRVAALSGGMRRRVDIAAALVTRPEVLFLDEPTTGLDPRSRAAVWETIAALREAGIAVLLTTQYLEEADRLADRVVVLDRGTVVASGTPAELKLQAGQPVCEITVGDAASMNRAADMLEDLGMVEPAAAAATAGEARLVVRAPAGAATVGEIIARLTAATPSVEIVDIGLRRPSLDEVFLQLTGSGA